MNDFWQEDKIVFLLIEKKYVPLHRQNEGVKNKN